MEIEVKEIGSTLELPQMFLAYTNDVDDFVKYLEKKEEKLFERGLRIVKDKKMIIYRFTEAVKQLDRKENKYKDGVPYTMLAVELEKI